MMMMMMTMQRIGTHASRRSLIVAAPASASSLSSLSSSSLTCSPTLQRLTTSTTMNVPLRTRAVRLVQSVHAPHPSPSSARRITHDHVRVDELPLLSSCLKNQVLVRAEAVAINPLDVMECQGYGQRLLSLTRPLPRVLGRDAVGTVVQVGSNVWNMKIGDRVWVSADPITNATFAQYIYASGNEISRCPASLTSAQAATIPFAFTTAWTALIDHAKVDLPDLSAATPPPPPPPPPLPSTSCHSRTAFVHGASGPVGLMACALLRASGFHVIGSVRNERSPLLSQYAHTIVSTVTGEKIDACAAEPAPALSHSPSSSAWHTSLSLDHRVDLFLDCVGDWSDMEDLALRWMKPACGSSFLTFRGSLLTDTDQHGLVRGASEALTAYTRIKSRFAALRSANFEWVVNRPSSRALTYARRMIDAGWLHALPLALVRSLEDGRSEAPSTDVYRDGIESVPLALDDVMAKRTRGGKVVIELV